MKKNRFTETPIFSILKEFDAEKNIREISRQHGVSKATIYNWKAKYGGVESGWKFRQVVNIVC